MQASLPRVVIAGLAGDTGKSLVALGSVRALAGRSRCVAPFKKGPDFIDAAWLGAAARRPGRNLDTFLMRPEVILASLSRASSTADIAIIEGNRGLCDGVDADGTHSTAQLARLCGAPVVLVIDVTKMTRTAAALVLGCRALDPDVQLKGVILNQVATARQEAVVRDAIVGETQVPVIGAIPRLAPSPLASRHLGLVPTAERADTEDTLGSLAEIVEQHIDLDALSAIAAHAPRLPAAPGADPLAPGAAGYAARASVTARPRIGVVRDEAFSFYYPENLEALENAGAELVTFSALRDPELTDIDALYIGGGFPEAHAARLAENRSFRRSLACAVDDGLPVWAECGGLMYLAEALVEKGERHEMVGTLPLVVERTARPVGHGYVAARVDGHNAFLPEGTELRGHEFHYSKAVVGEVPTVLALERGTGLGKGRDGACAGHVVAAYTHLHALGTPDWAPSLMRAARGEAT